MVSILSRGHWALGIGHWALRDKEEGIVANFQSFLDKPSFVANIKSVIIAPRNGKPGEYWPSFPFSIF